MLPSARMRAASGRSLPGPDERLHGRAVGGLEAAHACLDAHRHGAVQRIAEQRARAAARPRRRRPQADHALRVVRKPQRSCSASAL